MCIKKAGAEEWNLLVTWAKAFLPCPSQALMDVGLQPNQDEDSSDTESQISSIQGTRSLGIDESDMLGDALSEALANSPPSSPESSGPVVALESSGFIPPLKGGGEAKDVIIGEY